MQATCPIDLPHQFSAKSVSGALTSIERVSNFHQAVSQAMGNDRSRLDHNHRDPRSQAVDVMKSCANRSALFSCNASNRLPCSADGNLEAMRTYVLQKLEMFSDLDVEMIGIERGSRGGSRLAKHAHPPLQVFCSCRLAAATHDAQQENEQVHEVEIQLQRAKNAVLGNG